MGYFSQAFAILLYYVYSRCADNETFYSALQVNKFFDLPSVIASVTVRCGV